MTSHLLLGFNFAMLSMLPGEDATCHIMAGSTVVAVLNDDIDAESIAGSQMMQATVIRGIPSAEGH
ncbi:MAG: hypothetical protein U0R19_32250 [Bryobacteraceae bacterium]